MSDSLINLGELSKPATVLVERIADAVGGYFKPYQIKRIAEAEAEARKIEAQADIEILKLHDRALHRFVAEEARKQKNIEDIGSKALSSVKEDSSPEDIEEDWIVNFFDKCRLVSDEQMQDIWSRVLSGEANQPRSYSERTVNFLSSLDKSEAMLFTMLCRFAIRSPNILPLIYDLSDSIYTEAGLNFTSLKHLDNIGLISFDPIGGFKLNSTLREVNASYFDVSLRLIFPESNDDGFSVGKVMLSKIGQELSRVCNPEPVDGFVAYLAGKWAEKEIQTSKI